VFEHVLGYVPCALCLLERWPYYIGVPLALVVLVLCLRRAPRGLVAIGFALIALAFVIGLGLGVYHAGVEWKFWAGPSSCTAGAAVIGGDLMQSLRTTRVVPCDAAPWHFLGLSFAGWNAVASLVLAAISIAGLKAARTS
jgi:disulfide bond formation protein DsbB